MINLSPTVQKLFPAGLVNPKNDHEVNNLEKDSVPVGNILKHAPSRFPIKNERREWFIVEQDNLIFLLRVCTAHETCDYAEYAVIHDVSQSGDAEGLAYIDNLFKRQTEL